MKKNKPTRLLISGGAGFIGTNIALEALSRGYIVTVVDNFSRPGVEDNAHMLEVMGVDVIRADVTNLDTIPTILRPDCIIHLAAQVGIGQSLERPQFDFQQNVIGTVSMLHLAKECDSAFIFASTNKVYGENVNDIEIHDLGSRYSWDITGINEDFRTDCSHHTPYGVSKLCAENYVREYFSSFDVPTVVNRMSCIYGLYQKGVQDQGWVDFFVRKLLLGDGKLSVFGDGKQVRDVLWGEDVAKLYLDEYENMNKCAGQVFNIGGGPENSTSIIDAIREIEKQTDQQFELSFGDWRPADQKVYISDISKIKSVLGWQPTVSPTEGIARMIKEYKK